MLRCGAVTAPRDWRTTPPRAPAGDRCAPPARGWPRRPRTPPRTPLQGGARCARFDGGGRAHRACALCAVPCAVERGLDSGGCRGGSWRALLRSPAVAVVGDGGRPVAGSAVAFVAPSG